MNWTAYIEAVKLGRFTATSLAGLIEQEIASAHLAGRDAERAKNDKCTVLIDIQFDDRIAPRDLTPAQWLKNMGMKWKSVVFDRPFNHVNIIGCDIKTAPLPLPDGMVIARDPYRDAD